MRSIYDAERQPKLSPMHMIFIRVYKIFTVFCRKSFGLLWPRTCIKEDMIYLCVDGNQGALVSATGIRDAMRQAAQLKMDSMPHLCPRGWRPRQSIRLNTIYHRPTTTRPALGQL